MNVISLFRDCADYPIFTGSLPIKSRRFANILERGEKDFEQGVNGYNSLESLKPWNASDA